MKYLLSILAIIFSTFLLAQQPNDDVDYKYDRAYLEQLVEEEINAYRVTQKLPPFTHDDVLAEAAEDQAFFLLKDGKSGRVNHIQPSAKKETPFKRVMFYEGMHGKVSENCFKIVVGAPVKLPGSSKRIILKSYKNVALAIVKNWIDTKESKAILENNKYVNAGLAIVFDDKEKVIVATQVVGLEPYVLPEGVSPNRNDYGISPYNKSKCGELMNKYGYLPQLMSDNILFKNGEIYFYFHDLALFKDVLKDAGDKIALDIVTRDQFSCETGNKFYPSKLHTGILLPPISRAQVFGKNELKESGEIEVSLGPIPSFVDTNNTEFNLLIIKGNCLCQTIVYNSLGGENLHSLGMGLIMDTLSVANKADSVLNVLEFIIPFKKNKSIYNEADITPFLDSLSLNKYELKKIDIVAYSSIEGSIKNNKSLQKKRAASILKAIQRYNIKDVPTTTLTEEDWDGFFESMKSSPYEEKFKGLSKDAIREIVNSDTLSYDIEPYLDGQRKAKIKLTVEKVYMDESLYKMLPKRFNDALLSKNYAKAKIYQTVMINNAKNKQTLLNEILSPQIPHLKETVALNNNQIAMRWKDRINKQNNDSLNKYLLRDIETQLVIDPWNVYLKYNKIALRLLLWSTKYSREPEPTSLLKDIRSLYGTKIEKFQVGRLILNYNLVAADYYYDNNKFKERDRALSEVQKILLQSQLTRDYAFKVANYFIFQMRIDWVIDLMKPWAEKPNIDEEFLYTFLSVAIYNKKKVPNSEYLQFMKRAKKINKKRFCNLFGFPNMSFQLLKDVPVKELYCKTCH